MTNGTTAQKNILFIHHNGHPGGAECSLLDLVTHLDHSRFNPLVILPERGPLKKHFLDNNIDVTSLPIPSFRHPFKKPLKLISMLAAILSINLKLSQLIKQKKIDLIHANSATACLLCFIAATLCRKPLVWHERDNRHHRFLHPFLAFFCTRIIAISRTVENNLGRQLVKRSKITTVYNGINPMQFSVRHNFFSRRALGLPEKGRLVLMAAQLAPWKGHQDFILAAAKVLNKQNNVHFIISATMDNPDSQAYLSKLQILIHQIKLTKNVHFTGFIDDMPSLLKYCDCVVLPSKNEPFGRIVIETMAARKPIIAYAGGGPSEIIHHKKDGLLVPAGNIQQLANAINSVLDSPALGKRLGSAGFRTVNTRFQIIATAEGVANCFNEILS